MNDREATIKQAFEQPQWYLTKAAYNIRIRIETIQEFTRGVAPQSVLDIGCGDGSLSLPLLQAENQLTLLDRSKSMLERAQASIPEAAAGRVKILNQDFMGAALPAGSFDLIVCVGVLAYVEDCKPFLAKLVSLLKPNGAIILECTDGSHPVTHLIRTYKAARMALGGGKFPTIKRSSSELLRELAELGFKPGKTFRYSLPLPGLRRLLSQKASYRGIRLIYGAPPHSRAGAFGNECLYYLRRTY